MSRKKNKKSNRTNNNSNDTNNNNQQRQHQNNSQRHVYQGKLETTRSGMAFVVVEGVERDIMVRPHDLNTAQNGDEVTVAVTKQAKNQGRMEGVITQVTLRKKNDFTGTLQVSDNFAFLVSDKNSTLPDIYIPLTALKGGVSGDKALVKVTNWGSGTGKNRKPSGEVVEVLDARNAGDLAMKEILVDNGFILTFPDEVMEEVTKLPLEISEEEVAKRKDFRKVLTFTIDPYDAKDFDDAISIRLLKTGNYEVGVHIADVSHYVRPGSALDAEGYKRATSVYLPDRVLPMLPEKISNELCSLRPHEDKLTFSAMFEMTKEGEVKNKWIGRTVIHSDHRFTYEDVQEVIESGEGEFYRDEILLLNKMARSLRAVRFKDGAINFSSTEVKFQLDEDGKPIGVTLKESKEAHQLIEELMLLANRTVAEYVSELRVNGQPVPFPYRVHDNPDEEKLKIFAVFALQFGYKFDMHTPETIAASFNKMLQLAQGKPEQHVLETMGIRTMAKASYTTSNIGHYGLGFEHYAHFTSPIRRYPDVMVHRVLAECLAGDIHPDKEMESKCKHSSEMERKAMECERAGNKYKQVEYMQQFIGESFDGVISGVSHFGFWVETVDAKCEGLVSIHSLTAKDEFRYNENEYALVGANTGIKFRIGDKVKILVVAANLEKRQLDYDLDEPGFERLPGEQRHQMTGRGHGQHAPQQPGQRNKDRHRERDRNRNKHKERPETAQPQAAAGENGEPAPVVPPVVKERRPIVEYVHKPRPEATEGEQATADANAAAPTGKKSKKQKAAERKQRAIERDKLAAQATGTQPEAATTAPLQEAAAPAKKGKKEKVKVAEVAPVKEKAAKKQKAAPEVAAPVKKEKATKKEVTVKAKSAVKVKADDKKSKKKTTAVPPVKEAKADLKKVKSKAAPVPAKKLKEAAKIEKAVLAPAKKPKAAVKLEKAVAKKADPVRKAAKVEKKKTVAVDTAKKLKAKKPAVVPSKKVKDAPKKLKVTAPKKVKPAAKAPAKKVKEAPKKKAAAKVTPAKKVKETPKKKVTPKAAPAKKDKTKKAATPAKKAATKTKVKPKPAAKPKKAVAKKTAEKVTPKAKPAAKPKPATKVKPKAAAKKASAPVKTKAKPATKAKAGKAAKPAKAKPAAKKVTPKKKK